MPPWDQSPHPLISPHSYNNQETGFEKCLTCFFAGQIFRIKNKTLLAISSHVVWSVLRIRIRDPMLYYPRDPDPGWFFILIICRVVVMISFLNWDALKNYSRNRKQQ
jgi:hypothetical protein